MFIFSNLSQLDGARVFHILTRNHFEDEAFVHFADIEQYNTCRLIVGNREDVRLAFASIRAIKGVLTN